MTKFKYAIGLGQTRIWFSAKPADDIRSLMKGVGFQWSPSGGCWWRRGVAGAADFLAALDRKLNPGRPDGACWRCQSPNGFFRRQGAATPVAQRATETVEKGLNASHGRASGPEERREAGHCDKSNTAREAVQHSRTEYLMRH